MDLSTNIDLLGEQGEVATDLSGRPSKERMKQILQFLLQTSVPRILESEKKEVR